MVYRKVVLDKLLDPLLDAERLVSLEFHFKGDLTDSRIPLFIAEAPGVEEEAIIDSWSIGAAWALYPRRPKVLSISRWLYNIEPLAAVLDTFHDLKREALQVFLARTARADKKDDTSTLRAAVVDGQVVLTSPDAGEEISASKLWAALNHQTRMDLKEVCARNTTPLMLILTLS